jgi:CubicO group peptidase (beta-lactamase class C family)
MTTDTQTGIQGHCDPRFNRVRDVLEQQIANGEHVGYGVAVYHRGEKAVDLWGGLADEAEGTPWVENTMAVSYSVTKGLTSTCLHVLADRGLVDYQSPVTTYWPEFGQNGKEAITVYHLLTHQAGMAPVPGTMHGADLYDWAAVIKGLEEMAPAWEPGTESGYHANTYGFLVGEVIRRVSGKTVGQFLRNEICAPLGLRDMYIGAPAEVDGQIAKLVSKPSPPSDEMVKRMQERVAAGLPLVDPLLERAFGAPPGGLMAANQGPNPLDTFEGRRSEQPSANGVMTARDAARMYACLANGGELDGTRLMSPERVKTMSKLQTRRPDKVLSVDIAWSLGYMNGGFADRALGMRETAFGHPGVGGAVAFCDPEIDMAFAFTTNAVASDGLATGRSLPLATAAREAIEGS